MVHLDPKVRPTITVEEAATVLGISRGSAYAAARAGQIPVLRIGKRLIVPTARLLELLGHHDADPDHAA